MRGVLFPREVTRQKTARALHSPSHRYRHSQGLRIGRVAAAPQVGSPHDAASCTARSASLEGGRGTDSRRADTRRRRRRYDAQTPPGPTQVRVEMMSHASECKRNSSGLNCFGCRRAPPSPALTCRVAYPSPCHKRATREGAPRCPHPPIPPTPPAHATHKTAACQTVGAVTVKKKNRVPPNGPQPDPSTPIHTHTHTQCSP